MKKAIISAVFICVIMLVFVSCGNTETEKEPDAGANNSVTSEEELASILADANASNFDKNSAKHGMAQAYIVKANEYREKIKDEYRRLSEESDLYREELFPLEENMKKVDEYFDYLENEFESNVAFFESYAAAKYHTGTADSSLLADEEYKAAKRFAEKAEEIYNNLILN